MEILCISRNHTWKLPEITFVLTFYDMIFNVPCNLINIFFICVYLWQNWSAILHICPYLELLLKYTKAVLSKIVSGLLTVIFLIISNLPVDRFRMCVRKAHIRIGPASKRIVYHVLIIISYENIQYIRNIFKVPLSYNFYVLKR